MTFDIDELIKEMKENMTTDGEWLKASDGDGVVCSVCGTDFCQMIYETEKFNFCPNCGARLIFKEEEK